MFEPLTFLEIVGQPEFVSDALEWSSKDKYPNAVLLYGPPGTGKTTGGKVIAREMLKDFFDPMNFTMTNASDDRGIDFIRHELKNWASMKAIGADRRVILLDEADGLTPAAQDALRQVIELNADNTLFVLTANDITKIRPAIKSRCATYEFGPITPEDGASRLMQILPELERKRTDEWYDAALYLMHHCGGDMRRAIQKWAYSDTPQKILDIRISEASGSKAALAAVGGEWMNMRSSLYSMLDNGMTIHQVMRSFHQNLTSFFEMDADTTFTVMAVLGEMIPHMYEWSLGSYSFVDCLVARLKKEVQKNE